MPGSWGVAVLAALPERAVKRPARKADTAFLIFDSVPTGGHAWIILDSSGHSRGHFHRQL